MLSVENLSVSYGRIPAVRGVSLRVNRGEIVTLLGSNGAGKTSTLRAIMGLEKSTGGDIWLGPERISLLGRSPDQVARMGLGYVPEGRAILSTLTVLENLEVGRAAAGDRQQGPPGDYLDEILGKFPALRQRLHQKAGALSGGERQMLAIARALVGRPTVLLLDEPSLGLSPVVVNTVLDIIRRLNEAGMTVLMVEQNALKALQVAHRAYLLEQGSIVLEGGPEEFLRSPFIREAYLGGV